MAAAVNPHGTPQKTPARGSLAGARAYLEGMKILLGLLVILGMAATVGVLFAGLIGLARGGNPARSNRLMRWRVILQGVTLLLLALLLSVWRS